MHPYPGLRGVAFDMTHCAELTHIGQHAILFKDQLDSFDISANFAIKQTKLPLNKQGTRSRVKLHPLQTEMPCPANAQQVAVGIQTTYRQPVFLWKLVIGEA